MSERSRRWIVRIGALLLRALAASWRIRVIGDGGLRAARARRQPVIFTLWHGQMLPLLYQHRNEGVAILISEHRDGELIAQVAHRLGFGSVRGSTTRGAGRALLAMVRAVESGRDVAVTPDGPRGPARSFAPGALALAQRTGALIVPTTAHARWAWRLGSWDSFLIPRPFARVVVSYGEPTPVEAADARAASALAPRFQGLMEQAENAATQG
ncbi:MAG TPA: lysophospholipid acyltransferase family protein [Gemmatimonadaceae bacterium]|nr:lysophospholipid acyltransferase family protein [Gemmatimonadaceae bacterium]